MRRYLKDGDVFVDVGANIGDLTLAAASVVGSTGKVYSFEPHPRIYGFLSENIKLNNSLNVVLFSAALGDKESEASFAELGRSDDQNRISENGHGISIKMARLDDLRIPEPHIQLLKVDVEGYEKFVLQGAWNTLEKVSCVYFESWEGHFKRYGYHCGELIDLLSQKGFTVLKFAGNDTVVPVGKEYSSAALENLVAVQVLDDFLGRTRLHLAA